MPFRETCNSVVLSAKIDGEPALLPDSIVPGQVMPATTPGFPQEVCNSSDEKALPLTCSVARHLLSCVVFRHTRADRVRMDVGFLRYADSLKS